jgi:TonB family protein
MFRVAQNSRAFKVLRDLQPGEVLRLRLSGLGENQRLRFHRCGPECRTASTEATWDASQLPPDGRVEITIQVPGRYYFWVEAFSETSRPIGKVLVSESVRWEEQTLILRYGTGLEVIAEPVQTGLAAAPASAPADSASANTDAEEALRRASRQRAKGDFTAAADLFSQADRAAGGGSVQAVAGLCQAELELGHYVEAIDAARRWIELAGTPAERADAYHHLGLGLVQHGMDELYPFVRDARAPMAAGSSRRSSDRVLGTEMLRQAAEAFRRAASEPIADRAAVLLILADTLVRLEEYAEALEALDDYRAGGGKGALAEELRCWAEFAVRRAEKGPGGGWRSSDDAQAPVKVYSPFPGYTETARKARVQGSMIVAALIDEEGRVVCASAVTTLPKGLDVAAVDAVKQWRFRPATVQGEPVALRYYTTVNFTLQ